MKQWLSNLFFNKIETKEEFLKYIILGFSPLGVFVPSMPLFWLGICKGGLDAGLHCKASILEFYPGTVLMLMELSMYFLVGLLWIIVAIFVWLKILSYAYRTRPNIIRNLLIVVCSASAFYALYQVYIYLTAG